MFGTPQQYRVGPITSNIAFHYALDGSRQSRDPNYIKSVIRSYIDVKLARGRTKYEIAVKLELLEQELPNLAAQFQAVRAEYRLPDSRVFTQAQTQNPRASLSRVNTDNTALHMLRNQPTRINRTVSASPSSSTSLRPSPSRPYRTPTSARPTPITTTTRPSTNPEDGEEAPPPPYASQDPEPDSTRVLQERLAAEAEAAGRIAPELSTPITSQQASSSTPTPISARPSSSRINTERPSPPSTPPRNAEEARIWEESQLDEAKRASMAAERERLELEEAMRLSLQEATISNRSSPRLPSVFEEGESGPSSRRVSSYGQGSISEDHPRRRVASDAYATKPDLTSLATTTTPKRALQSNNPFLSPLERTQLPAELPDIPASPVNYDPPPGLPPKSASPGMGTGTYDPPPGPPPRSSPRRPLPRPGSQAPLPPPPQAVQQESLDVLLVDDNSTMTEEAWNAAQATVADVASRCDFGVDVYFTQSKRLGKGIKTAEEVQDLFAGLQPRGGARIGSRVETILRDYRSEGSKPMNLVVITDGAFANITSSADELQVPASTNVRIHFLQVGADAEAREALQQLSNNMEARGIKVAMDVVP